MRAARLLALSIVAAASLLAAGRDARACSLSGTGPPDELESAKFVVEAEVLRVVRLPVVGEAQALLHVRRSWKGSPPAYLLVSSTPPCAPDLPEGKVVAAFVSETADGYETPVGSFVAQAPEGSPPRYALPRDEEVWKFLAGLPSAPVAGPVPLWAELWLHPALAALPLAAALVPAGWLAWRALRGRPRATG